MRSFLCHFFGKRANSDFFDAQDAGFPVRPENEAEEFGEEIIEIFAFHNISIFLALGAGFVIVCQAAFSDAAPCRFFVFLATGTFF